MLELAAAAGGRIVPLAPAGRGPDSRACRSARTGSTTSPRSPVLDALRGSGFLFVHPVAGSPPRGARLVARARGLHEPDAARLLRVARGRPGRWPDVNVVFAILAGGGPIQLERLASRGVDVEAVLYSNVFFDTSSYGPRALEVCVETFGVEQLVFGSDAPVVDPAHAVHALGGLGEQVERLVREENLLRLLAG